MTRYIRTFAFAALTLAAVTMGLAQPATAAEDALTPTQRQAVEQIIREYLTANPEVVVEALIEMQRRDKQAEAEQQQNRLGGMKGVLEDNPGDPVMGNPNGTLTVVEFFDYRCGFCKRAFPNVQKMLKDYPDVRYVLKEWPILGDDSVFASRAAVSVWRLQPDKYAAFHTAMMTSKGSLTNDKVLSLAIDAGVDVDAMKAEMGNPEIEALFAGTEAIAGKLGMTGTPAFVFGDEIMPGAVDYATMMGALGRMQHGK